jgi:hypothetical protein
LFGITGVQPVVDAPGHIDGAALWAAEHGWVASHVPLVLASAGIPGAPLAGNATWFALGRIAPSSLPGIASPVAPTGATPIGVQSLFPPVDSELLPPGSLSGLAAVASPGVTGLLILNAAGVLPVSLAALAALALPGAGGLITLAAAGMRVGYRQAKAGNSVRTAGIAHFAPAGAVPLGVVRSGSSIVVHPRALRAVRPAALSAGRLLEEVA